MDYQQALLNVYRSHYPNGICKNFEKCSKGMPLYGHRCSIALLGCAYGNNGNPKIMFVGKEGVSDCGGATASSLYEPIAIENASPDNWHFICTIYTAALLLSKTDQLSEEEISFDKMRLFSELRHDFCLTNYYKCAFKTAEQADKHHNVRTSKEMQKHCAKILIDEVQAIRPDIIVMQGKDYHSSFWNRNGLLSFSNVCWEIKPEKSVNISVTKYVRSSDQSIFYVLWSYHPCAHGRRWFHTLHEFHQAIDYIKSDM